MPEELERCLAAGMLDRVTKPVDLDLLVETILRHAARTPQMAGKALCFPGVPSPLPETEPYMEQEAENDEDIIDYKALYQRFGDHPAFISELMKIVRTTCGDTPARLHEAAARREFRAIAALAHSLKSTAGNLCAPRAFKLAGETEALARSAAPQAFAAAEKLAGAMEELLDVLAEQFADGVG